MKFVFRTKKRLAYRLILKKYDIKVIFDIKFPSKYNIIVEQKVKSTNEKNEYFKHKYILHSYKKLIDTIIHYSMTKNEFLKVIVFYHSKELQIIA